MRDAQRLPDVGPPGLRDVLACCLAKSPSERYPDARALGQDLDLLLRDRPITHATRRARIA
ncbi:MAG: hypothetical protein AAF772_13190 [Acidobacteriota bacterium]